MDGQQFLKEFLAAGMSMAQDTKEDGFATLTDKNGNTYVAQMNESEKTRYKETGKPLSKVKKEESEKKPEAKKEDTEKETKRDVVDHLVKLGGKLWNDKRIYIKDIARDWLEVNADFYNTGNLRSFEWIEGKESNSQGNRILSAIESSYFDIPSRTFKAESYSRPELAQKVVDMLTKEAREQGLDVNDPVKKEPKKEPEILKRNYAEETDRINDIIKKLNEPDYKKAEESDLVKNYPALAENLKNERDRSYLTAVINNTGLTNKTDFIKYLKEFNAGVLERLYSTEDTLLYKQREKQISNTKEGEGKESGTKESSSGKVSDLDKYMKGWNRKIYKYRDGTKAIFSNNQKIVLTEEQYNYLKDKAAN
ncbi:hypothetical protein [Ruminobacter sp.]|uniref:hypothetical protein n=1 Tax=Ruminobacter sp. TaxID=2774296 RepID=UPI003865B0E1